MRQEPDDGACRPEELCVAQQDPGPTNTIKSNFVGGGFGLVQDEDAAAD